MARYRHTVTGGERESSTRLGYPWQLIEQEPAPKAKKGRRAKVTDEQDQHQDEDAEAQEQSEAQADEAQAEDAAEDAKEDEQA